MAETTMPLQQVTAPPSTSQGFVSRSGIWRILVISSKCPPPEKFCAPAQEEALSLSLEEFCAQAQEEALTLSLEEFCAQAQEALTLLVDQLLAEVDRCPERDQACNVAVQSFRPDCSSFRVTVKNLSLVYACDNVFHADNASNTQEWVQQKHPFLFQTRAQVADQPFGHVESDDLRRLHQVMATCINNCTVDQNGVVILPEMDCNLGADR